MYSCTGDVQQLYSCTVAVQLYRVYSCTYSCIIIDHHCSYYYYYYCRSVDRTS